MFESIKLRYVRRQNSWWKIGQRVKEQDFRVRKIIKSADLQKGSKKSHWKVIMSHDADRNSEN